MGSNPIPSASEIRSNTFDYFLSSIYKFVSFVDAYLGAAALIGKNNRLYTFDKKLLKTLGSGTVEPN